MMLAEPNRIVAFDTVDAVDSEIEYNGLFTWDMYLVAASIMAGAAVIPGFDFFGEELAFTVSGDVQVDTSADAWNAVDGDIRRSGMRDRLRSEGTPLCGVRNMNPNLSDILSLSSPELSRADFCGFSAVGTDLVSDRHVISKEEKEMSSLVMPSGFVDMNGIEMGYDGGFKWN